MTRDEMMRALGAWEREWAARWAPTITPDPQYRDGKRQSQYPETAVHLNAGAAADAEYWAGVDRIIAAADLS